jgi:hypothetical protein
VQPTLQPPRPILRTDSACVSTRERAASTLRDAAIAVAFATAAVTALLAYRLYCQLSGWTPPAGAEVWFYTAAGSLVDPFRGAETVEPVREAAYLELAALVALEVYLAAGAAAAVLLWTGGSLIRDARLPPVIAAARALAAAACSLAWRPVAYLRTRDWARYRESAVRAWDAAYAVSRPAFVAARRHGVALLHLMARDASAAALDAAALGGAAAAEARAEWAKAWPEFWLLARSLDGTAKDAFGDVGGFTRGAAVTTLALGMAVASLGRVSPRAGGRRLSRRELFQRALQD